MLFRRLNVVIAKSLNLVFKSGFKNNFSPLLRMQEGFVGINSVPTHVLTWGQWIEDKFEIKNKEMILIITGELPGV